jgi:hypothetical protein
MDPHRQDFSGPRDQRYLPLGAHHFAYPPGWDTEPARDRKVQRYG